MFSKIEDHFDHREEINRAAFRKAAAEIKKRPKLKTALYITGGAAAVACVVSFYGIALLLAATAVILGLASKA